MELISGTMMDRYNPWRKKICISERTCLAFVCQVAAVAAPRDRYQGELWTWLKKAGILSWAKLWKSAQKGCTLWNYRTRKCTG